MYTVDGKKMMNICILNILKQYTDSEHTMEQGDIMKKLKSEYGMTVDRKSIKANLTCLLEFGYPIEYTEIPRIKKDGSEEILTSKWYYNHDFDDAELRMLIDSVLFSRTIPGGQAQELIDKITKLSNVYFTNKVKHVCNLPELAHTDNKQTMYNVELIDDAISEGRKIAFVYNAYGTDKQLHPRREEKYVVNPYQMVASNGKYYLICNYDKYDNLSNYRIDRMTEVEILDEPVKDRSLVREMEQGLNLPKHMAEHIYMFSDKPETIVLRVNQDAMSDMVDWFGKSFDVLPASMAEKYYLHGKAKENQVYVKVNCSHKAMFHWAMQYGTTVEVVSPEHLRDEIKKAVSNMLAIYNM